MRIPSQLRLVALGTLAVAAACADPVAPPAAPDAAPSLARSASAGSGRPIPDQYIVVFDDDVRDVPGLARGLADAHGATVRFEYEHALKGFAGRMSAQAAATASVPRATSRSWEGILMRDLASALARDRAWGGRAGNGRSGAYGSGAPRWARGSAGELSAGSGPWRRGPR